MDSLDFTLGSPTHDLVVVSARLPKLLVESKPGRPSMQIVESCLFLVVVSLKTWLRS